MINKVRPLTFYSLWSINDRLDILMLKKQLLELKLAGLRGVVFHPRNYPNKPEYLGDEYMRILSELIVYAKSIGMKFWIYDENGWPSGTAGGQVLKNHPELECQWIEIIKAENSIFCEDSIHTFRYQDNKIYSSDNEKGELYHILLKSKRAVNSLDPKAAEYFISMTHERYKAGLSPEAFDYITGFFSDEAAFLDGHSVSVAFGGIPWSKYIKDKYFELYKQDIIPLLPMLFLKDDGYDTFRTRFWELLTDALNDSFYIPIKNWCMANGKEFTAHLKAEENPFFQLSYSGSCFNVLKNVTVPAVDALERYQGNNYYPRIAYSVSAQFREGDCLVEAMGGAGWGVAPEQFVNYMLWLAGHGLNNFVIHLNQLCLNTQAVKDWPPSMPCHLTWKEAFPEVLKEIQKRAELLPDVREEAELLIVSPTRGVMAEFEPHDAIQMNEHNGTNLPVVKSCRISLDFLSLVEECNKAGIRYELTEERAIEEYGEIKKDSLKIGKRSYKKILLPEGCRFNQKGNEILKELSKSGNLIFDSQTWKLAFNVHRNDTYSSKAGCDKFVTVKQTPWEAEAPEENQFLIEFDQAVSGNLTSLIRTEDEQNLGPIEMVCMDMIEEAFIDGRPLNGIYQDDEHVFKIPKDFLNWSSRHVLEVRTKEQGEKHPFVFLKGQFAVQSQTSYIYKDENQVKTKGPFVIKPISYIHCNDFIETGYPFCGKPIKVSKIIELVREIEDFSIKLTDLKADALRVIVDGQDLGWCWGPDWTVQHKGCLRCGQHGIDIFVVPNTYNVFGPHHHIDGDRHLISPAQYEGVKNFADRIDAPDKTRCKEWSFVRFYIKGHLLFNI